jgi:hypothetical protein
MSTQVTRDWEARFTNWKGKASDGEEEKYKRTCRAIGSALEASDRLSKYEFDVYAKGSYPNFTNVVRDSDVDIAVELTTFFQNRFIHAAKGLTMADVGVTPYEGDATLVVHPVDSLVNAGDPSPIKKSSLVVSTMMEVRLYGGSGETDRDRTARQGGPGGDCGRRHLAGTDGRAGSDRARSRCGPLGGPDRPPGRLFGEHGPEVARAL